MPITTSNITTELISDFAAGRLDVEDAQVIQEAINHDEVIATAVCGCASGQLANEPMVCNIDIRRACLGRWPDASSEAPMMTRSDSKTVVFSHPFELKGVDRVLPPGNYRVVTDEELIQELSFPVYRRISTMIFVPVETYNASIEMVTIDPRHLQEALDRDRAIP